MINYWNKERALRNQIRAEQNLNNEIPADKVQEYNLTTRDMLAKYKEAMPPAMPCYTVSGVKARKGERNKRPTSENSGPSAMLSEATSHTENPRSQ